MNEGSIEKLLAFAKMVEEYEKSQAGKAEGDEVSELEEDWDRLHDVYQYFEETEITFLIEKAIEEDE